MVLSQPTMRLVARRLVPSVSSETICARFSIGSLFILNIMLERSGIVKGNVDTADRIASGAQGVRAPISRIESPVLCD